jgi:hypothetical protein
MDIVVSKMSLAVVGMGGEGGYEIKMLRVKFHNSVGVALVDGVNLHLCISLRNIVEPGKRTAHVLPVPIGIVYGESYV